MTGQNETPSSVATLRRAFRALEGMQRQLEKYQQARTEPIAIIGLGCRLPGGIVDAQSFWNVLGNGVDAITEVPADRWDIEAFYDKEPQQPGKIYARTGGFIDHLDEFDHSFFEISRREALNMDPQQRLCLQVAWEALENAGQSPQTVSGSRTGVFVGVSTSDFVQTHFQHPLSVTAYASTGTAHSALTGRLSYALNLRGPNLAVDTACSSSLVAIQLACQSLREGDSTMALAGGVNVVLSPLTSIAYSQFPGMVSPDGICKTFDAAANGSIASDGCGFVVLKRLSDAVKDGDQVLAVIRGGAVNQDGRTSGLTAPSAAAQQEVIRRALEVSQIAPQDVSYVEAHGSGTPLGDPIEVEALAEVYGRPEGTPVYLGTVKTNIGHTQAAAGVTGVIKIVLSMQHDVIPPHLHFSELNPEISFEGTTFAVPTVPTPWPAPGGRRIAGISAFAFSGTNAHLIIEAGPARAQVAADDRRPLSLLALSAKTESALVELAGRYADRLSSAEDTGTRLADLCFSANTGRSHFTHRLAAVAGTKQQLSEQLRDYVDGLPGDEPAVGRAGNAEVVFLFTGQGSQRAGNGLELYETQPTFRKVIDDCDEILRPVLGGSLLPALFSPESGLLNQPTFAQPAMLALEYGLSEMWRSWGVVPSAVLGYSFGEYVAATVAGAMSLEDALKLVVERGRLLENLPGTMAVVFAPEHEVAAALVGLERRISIATVNGPANTVISGEVELVEAICADFDARGVKTRRLKITNSGHSPLVEPILPGLRQALERVRFSPPRIPVVSNVTGQLWAWDKAPDADYWCAHARQPVRFTTGLATLREMGFRNFVEIGPAPTLLGLVSENSPVTEDGPDSENRPAGTGLLLPSLRPKNSDWRVLMSSVAQLYVHGADVDWRGFDRDYQRSKVSVPTYPFARVQCWEEPRYQIGGLAGAQPQPWDAPVEGSGDPAEYDDADLLYQLEWQPAGKTPPPPVGTGAELGTWLVLGDGTGVGEELTATLAARGGKGIRVVLGSQYHYDRVNATAVVREGRADLARLIGELELSPADSLRLVHLWGLSAGDQPEEDDSAAEQSLRQQRACLSAAWAVQALADSHPVAPARLWLVTRGAVQPAGHESGPLAVSQSTLWGLGRSLEQEHPGFWGGLIDLDPRPGAGTTASRLIQEIENPDAEDQVAVRGDDRYVARLVRTPAAPAGAGPAVWRPDASYLVTGGLTGIGLEVARSMVRAGARRLVLVGRTPIPPRPEWAGLSDQDPVGRRVAAVRELEALGASIHLESFDIGDEVAAQAFLTRFDAEGWPAIRGVVHSAGVAAITPLLDLTEADLARELRPKSVGAWVLHRLFAGRPLDFFVLFGSGSSILSSPFMAAYAAANAFLDALAQSRRGTGQPGLCIGWGLWKVGMAEVTGDPADPIPATGPDGVLQAGGTVRAQLGLTSGMGTITPPQGVRVFHHLLQHGPAQVAVVPIDWSAWGARYQSASRSPVLAELVSGSGALPTGRGRSRPSLLPTAAELLALPEGERPAALTTQLHLSVAARLEASAADVRADQPLIDLGFDSLMAVELRNDIEGRLSVFLPVSVFLSDASVNSVADQIMALLADRAGSSPGSPQEDPAIPRVSRADDLVQQEMARILAEIQALSEDEVLAAIEGINGIDGFDGIAGTDRDGIER